MNNLWTFAFVVMPVLLVAIGWGAVALNARSVQVGDQVDHG